ncbi:hypothetical protein A2153_02475 [Candidatus Gottesmanbacteria bacterium RBG_16_38_7b]|uniref:PIN domain-containing protein n=1 Tax=Candidatus Gottesmanbacteria bacterium RBG_16_38_7b TaxID=1798372 RepID=A0A1F5YF70_9BACT|nr:MAG: hypothetical protein A2153_02475 [Candidatus Gottesmanbacteria bacterium RBG_16_38_7b]
MENILVDTDILIDYTKGKSVGLKQLLQKQIAGKVKLFINPVIISEFFTDKSLNDKSKFRWALEFISNFSVTEINKKIGILSGEFRRIKAVDYIADALIAATCLENNFILATRNKKHFSKIKNLKIISHLTS